jgi:lipopolysaccharide export system protein LptA
MIQSAIFRRKAVAALACAIALVAMPAHAEKADREKNINFSADQPVEVDFDKRTGTLRGNVVITQGTLTIHADRINFKQNPDDSLSATAWGNPIRFREKKDNSDEYYEGYAQRAIFNGQTHTLELFDNALLKEGNNEFRGNYISYNSETNFMKAEGRPNAPGGQGPGPRVQGVFEPRADSPLGGKDAPKGDAKGAGDGKDAGKSDAKGDAAKSAPKPDGKADGAKGAARATAAANAAPPLALTPDATLSAK